MFWAKYPNTNFHELNLDWILETVKDLMKKMGEFEALNTVHFEGDWNITEQYTAWSIVLSDNAYISLKPVPAGIDIHNSDYWKLVIDLSWLNKRQNYTKPEYFGAVGDGLTDDTIAIQKAIDYAQSNRVMLVFDTKTYTITSPLKIASPVFIDGNDAIIRTYDSMTALLEVDIQAPLPAYGRGIVKDLCLQANYAAVSAIEITSNINAIIFQDIQILNPLNYGIYGNPGMVQVYGCMIRNTDSAHLNIVGIRCDGSDNEIIGYMAVNCFKSMVLNGSSRVERNTSWNSFAGLMKTSVFAEVNASCDLIDCMIDTWAIGLDGNNYNVRLTNCVFYWNSQYYTDAAVGDSTTRALIMTDAFPAAYFDNVKVFKPMGRSVQTSLFSPTVKSFGYDVRFKNNLEGVYNIPTVGTINVSHTSGYLSNDVNEYSYTFTPTGRHYKVSVAGSLQASATDRTPVLTDIPAEHRPTDGVVMGKGFVGYYNGDMVPVLWDGQNNRFVLITPSGTTYASGTYVYIDIEYDRHD